MSLSDLLGVADGLRNHQPPRQVGRTTLLGLTAFSTNKIVKVVLAAFVALSLLVAATEAAKAAPASSSFTACSYQLPMPKEFGMTTISLAGSAMTPAYCEIFRKAMGAGSRTTARGSIVGVWTTTKLVTGINMTVRSTKPVYGRLFVQLFAPKLKGNPLRLRRIA
jgi:hypothetical protein